MGGSQTMMGHGEAFWTGKFGQRHGRKKGLDMYKAKLVLWYACVKGTCKERWEIRLETCIKSMDEGKGNSASKTP